MKADFIFSEYVCNFCGGAITPWTFCDKCWGDDNEN